MDILAVVMIVWFSNNEGVHSQTVQFSTMAACEKAVPRVMAAATPYLRVQAVCMKL